MMAGNPNWWSINTMHPQPQQQAGYHESPSSSSQYLYASSPLPSSTPLSDQQDYPRSWSQLLIGGLANDPEGTLVGSPINYEYKKLDPNWEGQILNQSLRANPNGHEDVKLEDAENSLFYGGGGGGGSGGVEDEFHQVSNRPCWSQVMMPASSPSSSTVTSLCSSLLNFSSSSKVPYQEVSPWNNICNSTRAGSVAKKPKIQHSKTQPAMKVRKEKLGDRITALHQLVSPFGKTDTASVLSESVGYIRFLQAQIQALSSPYLGGSAVAAASRRSMGGGGGGLQQSSVTDFEDRPKDLRSRGLCLVPVSCTLHVGSDNGADYWAPTLGGGF